MKIGREINFQSWTFSDSFFLKCPPLCHSAMSSHQRLYMSCSPIMSNIARDVLVWCKHGWNKQHRKDQNCCINQWGGESKYPKLMLYYTNTRKYCGKEANLQVTVVLCLPTWMRYCFPGHGSHVTEQKSHMVVIYEPAKPTRILLVELTVRWDTANNFVKKDRKVWKIDGRFDPCWLWCTQPSSRDRMWGSEDAANLEYICNQVWIFCIDDTG